MVPFLDSLFCSIGLFIFATILYSPKFYSFISHYKVPFSPPFFFKNGPILKPLNLNIKIENHFIKGPQNNKIGIFIRITLTLWIKFWKIDIHIILSLSCISFHLFKYPLMSFNIVLSFSPSQSCKDFVKFILMCLIYFYVVVNGKIIRLQKNTCSMIPFKLS